MTDKLPETCYACGEAFTDSDWIVPLPTFRAGEWDGQFVLDADSQLETVVHLSCLTDKTQETEP